MKATANPRQSSLIKPEIVKAETRNRKFETPPPGRLISTFCFLLLSAKISED